MKKILNSISWFLTSHFYKWILPATVTYGLFMLEDVRRNLLLRLALWFFLVAAFVSIPINFERPKKQYFEAYINKKTAYNLIASIQVVFLGVGVFIITHLAVLFCVSLLSDHAIALSAINGMLYSGCLILEFALLPEKLYKIK